VIKYKKGEDVPTHVIINRLNSLSDDVTKGITRNFGMSIPARLDYDADLVLSIAARRLARIDELEAKVKRLVSELEKLMPVNVTVVLHGSFSPTPAGRDDRGES
jgi:chlorite dismutase